MLCEEFESRLNDLLDARRAPARDPLLREHAAACAACSALMRDYKLLLQALEQLPLPELSSDFAAKVAEQAQPAGDLDVIGDRFERLTVVPRTTASARPRLRQFAGVGIAAALLVALTPVVVWFAAQHNPLGQPTAAVPISEEEARKQSLAAMRQRLTDVLDLLPVGNPEVSAELGMSDSLTSRLSTEFAPSVEPLAFTAGRSLVALFRVMPAGVGATPDTGIKQ